MSSLKVLRHRIQSIKSTRKITSAMKLIATAHFKKLQKHYETSALYSYSIFKCLDSVLKYKDLDDELPLFLKETPKKRHLIIVLGSDRGLCGGFNVAVTKQLSSYVSAITEEVKFLCVGTRVEPLLPQSMKEKVIKIVGMNDKTHYSDALNLAYFLESQIALGEFDCCSIVYNRFQSIISYVPTVHPLIPFTKTMKTKVDCTRLFLDGSEDTKVPLFGVEPDVRSLLKTLAFKSVTSQLHAACIESQLSEQSARMMAMDNSMRSAEDMLHKLETTYHRSRQAMITNELIEIIAGAESL